jgi:tetratricopeptide (TPR) repeat protein
MIRKKILFFLVLSFLNSGIAYTSSEIDDNETVERQSSYLSLSSMCTEGLPLEIFSHIFSYLSPEDLKSVYCVCRGWAAMIEQFQGPFWHLYSDLQRQAPSNLRKADFALKAYETVEGIDLALYQHFVLNAELNPEELEETQARRRRIILGFRDLLVQDIPIKTLSIQSITSESINTTQALKNWFPFAFYKLLNTFIADNYPEVAQDFPISIDDLIKRFKSKRLQAAYILLTDTPRLKREFTLSFKRCETDSWLPFAYELLHHNQDEFILKKFNGYPFLNESKPKEQKACLQVFKKILSRSPEFTPENYMILARLFIDFGAEDKSLLCFKRAGFPLSVDYVNSYLAVGKYLCREKKIDKALPYFEKSLRCVQMAEEDDLGYGYVDVKYAISEYLGSKTRYFKWLDNIVSQLIEEDQQLEDEEEE